MKNAKNFPHIFSPPNPSLFFFAFPQIAAIGGAANSCGSITDIKEAVRAIRRGSQGAAVVYVDGVHYAPHRLIDVQARVHCTTEL